MADQTQFKPAGKYTLKKFELSTITTEGSSEAGAGDRPTDQQAISDAKSDIKGLVHVWNIEESIMKGYLRGSAKIYDANGVYYGFPIRGQEKLTIVYEDWAGESRTEDMMIYAVTDIRRGKENDDSMLEYTIHFVSWGKFWSDRYTVSRCIADGTGSNRRYVSVDQQVEVLFDDYYYDNGQGTQKRLFLQPTDGDAKIVIPNYRPEEAMHLMSRKAYDANFKSHYFRFYENRDQYNFVNLESMVYRAQKAKKKYSYGAGTLDQTPEAEKERMSRLITIEMQSPVDTFECMKSGAYRRKLSEVDIINRRVITTEYDHTEYATFEYYYPGSGIPGAPLAVNLLHTQDFIDEHLNNPAEDFVIKDYPDSDRENAYGLSPKTNYGEVYPQKKSYFYDYKQSRYVVKIYGDNKIVAGDIIELEIPYFTTWDKTEQPIDRQRSGYYLVESINNEFAESTYVQTLTVSRGPLADA